MVKKLFAITIVLVFSNILLAKIEFPVSDKKIAAMRDKIAATRKDPCLDSIKYHVNLMWINQKLKEDQKGIHPSNDKFVETILRWAAYNKNSVIHVWFDGNFTSPEAIENTQKLINNRWSRVMAPIVLKDIHSLPEVSDNETVFGNPQVPVYFRADLARAIVGHNAITRHASEGYFVYSDLDISPLSKESLFDEKTQKILESHGMVLPNYDNGGPGNYENGFQIITNNKPNLIEAHKTALVDVNIERARNAVNGLAHEPVYISGDNNLYPYKSFYLLQEIVHSSYYPMFEYFYQLEGKGTCILDKDYNYEEYNKDIHGLEPFGLRKFSKKFTLTNISKGVSESNGIFIPKKNVNYPRVSKKYCNRV